MWSKASPVNPVCDIVLRKYVFSRLKANTFLSHSHLMTGKVENILKHSLMLGYIVWSISFKVADAIVGTVLGSCRSHFVIKSSRHQGSKVRATNLHGTWKTGQRTSSMFLLMLVALTEHQIGTASAAVSWSPLPNRFSCSLIRWSAKGNREISPIAVFYRFSRGVCTVALYLTSSWFLHCDAQLLGNLACFLKPFCMFLFYLLAHRR